MTGTDTELGLVALAAMLSPTTLSFSILALVLSRKPLRTGWWFFLGAFVATMAVGVLAAFVLGNVAASPNDGEPKTWVAILDLAFAVAIIVYVISRLRRPADPHRIEAMVEKMTQVASAPAVAIVGAGAMLANPGGFIPIALKGISELNPDAVEYILLWLGFTLIALLPLALCLPLLLIAPDRMGRLLARIRVWLERNLRVIAAVILFLLAAALLRNGIAGLTA